MKNIYFTIAVLFFAFTSCKNTENADTENSNDTIAVQQDKVEANDTVTYDPASAEEPTDTTESSSSDVKLPNKISTSTSTTYTDPAKGKYPLAETKWKLVELNGNAIEATNSRDYFINFDSKSGTFRAFAGCSKITGKYFMKSQGKVGFTDITTTKKTCDNMDVERNFFNNLQKVDNYMIEGNGKMMHLHIGKKAVAKFEAVK